MISTTPVRALPFFRRGPGPLVSVILPTRGRSDPLRAAVDSCVSLIQDKTSIEFLFKVDDDDKETLDTIRDMERTCPMIPMHTYVSPRGNGYHDIWKWDNELASRARGDWLFLMNDDAVIKTENWDRILQGTLPTRPWAGTQDVCLLVAETIGRPFAQEFLFLRRRSYELMGHMFLSPHGDNWLYGVFKFLGAEIHIPMLIDHYSGVIGDKTRETSVEAYKTAIQTLVSPPARWEQLRDASILLSHISKCLASMVWYSSPKDTGRWYYWKDSPDGVFYLSFINEHGHCATFKNDGASISTPAEMGGLWSPT